MMKYKLIVDKSVEEEIIAIVHAPSFLTQEIENLVCSYSGADSILGYKEDDYCLCPLYVGSAHIVFAGFLLGRLCHLYDN